MAETATTYRLMDDTQYGGKQAFKLTKDGRIMGRAVVANDGRFRAFLKSSEYADGDYIGEFDTLPEAVVALKEMDAMR
jgi:hypothetical protein